MFYKTLIYIIIGAVLITFVFLFYLFFSYGARSIEVEAPNGGEELGIGQIYEIAWNSKGIDKVGIALFKGKEPKWIAKNIDASLGKYEWKIYPGQNFGDNYWIAVFEYPWKKRNKIDFSDGALAVIYSEFSGCEGISTDSEWLYLPSDMPGLRRIFITEKSFKGDLGGLDGADEICREQALTQGFRGDWHAFIGGDDSNDFAVSRLKRTTRGTKGVFVQARIEATLVRGATCHRLLGRDFTGFLEKFSSLALINKEKLDENFLESFGDVWLGRLNSNSKKTCVKVDEPDYGSLSEKYSYTVTCQNWTNSSRIIEENSGLSFPTCYTPEGKTTEATGLGGLVSEITGKGFNESFDPNQGEYCDQAKKLICIEE